MKETRELNELVAPAADVISEASEEKARKKEQLEKEATDNIAKNSRDAGAEEEKRLELIPILTVHVNQYTNKEKEVDYNRLIEETKKDKKIKVAVLKEILKYYFKLTPEEFRGGKSDLLIFCG